MNMTTRNMRMMKMLIVNCFNNCFSADKKNVNWGGVIPHLWGNAPFTKLDNIT